MPKSVAVVLAGGQWFVGNPDPASENGIKLTNALMLTSTPRQLSNGQLVMEPKLSPVPFTSKGVDLHLVPSAVFYSNDLGPEGVQLAEDFERITTLARAKSVGLDV